MITKAETERRKAEARKYVDRVIDEMALSASDLRGVITRYMDRIVTLSEQFKLGKDFQFSANPELEKGVENILDEMKIELFNIIYLRSENVSKLAYDKESKSYNGAILSALLASQIAGSSVEKRISAYVDNLKYEIEAYTAVGLDRGLSKNRIINTFLVWLKEPFKSPLITNAYKEAYKASRIKSKGISFGIGKTVSTFNNLKLLEQDTIFRAFNHTVNELWMSDADIVGWYTVRGSSYPCQYCDDMVGVFHPKSDYYYGYHRRCCCIMIPVNIGEV